MSIAVNNIATGIFIVAIIGIDINVIVIVINHIFIIYVITILLTL